MKEKERRGGFYVEREGMERGEWRRREDGGEEGD